MSFHSRCKSSLLAIIGPSVWFVSLCIILATFLQVRADDIVWSDDFDSYNDNEWGAQSPEVTVEKGKLRNHPKAGQVYFSSAKKFKFGTLEARVRFNRLSTDSSIFYYLGLQSVTPWLENVCWLMVQDSAVIATVNKAGGKGQPSLVANVEAGRWYKIKIAWSGSKVELFLDGNKIFATEDPAITPDSPMPVFIAANSLAKAGPTADLEVDWVTVRGGSMSDGQYEAAAAPVPAARAEPAAKTETVHEPPVPLQVLLEDDFNDFNPHVWGTQPGDVTVSSGKLIDRPRVGQQVYIASNKQFQYATFESRLGFETLSKDSTVFYYVGFQSVTPWTHNVCWAQVQDNALSATVRNGTTGKSVHQQIGYVEPGKAYDLKIVWTPSKVEYYLDGDLKLEIREQEVIPVDAMPVFLSANSAGKDELQRANLQIDSVKISGQAAGSGAAADARPAKLFPKNQVGREAGARIKVEGEYLDLENASLSCRMVISRGLRWGQIRNKITETDCFFSEENSPLFMLLGKGFATDSAACTVEDVALTEKDGAAMATIKLTDPASGLKATVTVSLGDADGLDLALSVMNPDKETRRVQTVFPILGRVSIGDNLAGNEYFFPWRSGIAGKVDCDLSHEYGSLGWMQVISVFDPDTKTALYTYPKDSSGTFKGMVFKKLTGNTKDMVRHSEAVNQLEMPKKEIFAFEKGMGLAYYYLPQDIAAGGTMNLPESVVTVYRGDWKRALKDYSAWAHTWYKHVDTPRWFKDCFNFRNVHPPGYYSKEKGGYIYSDKLKPGEHILQWGFFEDYVDKPDMPFSRQMEKYEPGDFEYNKSRGGLKPFKEEIQKCQAKGSRFTVYINHRFCWRETKTGKAYGKKWGAYYSPGEYGYYSSPDDQWVMCFYEPGAWADYLASTCGRIVRETGMDGIYLDELVIPFPCYNPAHTHFQKDRSPVNTSLLAASIAKCRAAMVRENPQAILMTEHAGSDYFSQFFDGSWVQTFYTGAFAFAEKHFDDNSLIYFRFAFPEFKLAQWGESNDGERRCFFNGIGKDSGCGQDADQVMKENGDALATLKPEPLVETKVKGLLANKFPIESKTLYMLYNKTPQTIKGEIMEVEPRPGTHFVELLRDEELAFRNELARSRDVFTAEIKAGEVVCVAQLPKIITAEADGETVRVSLAREIQNTTLVAFVDRDSSYKGFGDGKVIELSEGKGEIEPRKVFGHKGKLILKLYADGYLVDQTILEM